MSLFVKRFAFLLLALTPLAASEHLYFYDEVDQHEDEIEQTDFSSENQDFSEEQDRALVIKPIDAGTYLLARDTYILKSKIWVTLNLSQAMFDIGEGSDFSDDSYVMNIPRTLSVIKNSSKPKKRFIGLSFLGRGTSFAYGLSLDYFSGIKDEITDILLVDSNSASVSLKNGPNPFSLKSDFAPILFKTRYYFTDGQRFQPFIGGGFGATYMKNSIEYDSQKFSDSSWSLWTTALEAGVTVCLSPSYSMDVLYQGVSAQFKSAIIDDQGALIRLKSPLTINSIKVGLNIYW